VTLIAGPLSVPVPAGLDVVHVQRTQELEDAVRHALPGADLLVMAAAPADFHPTKVATSKIKKGTAVEAIALEPNVDILTATVGARKQGSVVVGFALETDDLIANAKAKLEAKSLDMIVANAANENGAGFGTDTNRVTILARGTEAEPLALMSKDDVADAILDRVEPLLPGNRRGR
jgi:phosphopantothenoylcysteine decarboxylase/phosphopantothenate--cysteine ligase